MGLLLGALAGAAQNYDKQAEEQQKEWTQEHLMQLQHQNDLAKVDRVGEMQSRIEKEKSQRDIENIPLKAKAEASAVKENAPILTQAELDRQNALLPAELAKHQGLADIDKQSDIDKSNALLPNQLKLATAGIDSQGRNLEHQLTQAKIDEMNTPEYKAAKANQYKESDLHIQGAQLDIQAKKAELSGMPKDAVSALNVYRDEVKTLQLQAGQLSPGTPERAAVDAQIVDAFSSAHSILSKYGYRKTAKNSNPLGIGENTNQEPDANTKQSVLDAANSVRVKRGLSVLSQEEFDRMQKQSGLLVR